MGTTWLYCSVLITLCLYVKPSYSRTISSDDLTVISINNGFDIGLWGKTEFCPDGMYAAGFEQKIEPYRGTGYDNSALNGVRLFCRNDTSTQGCSEQTISSSEGRHGEWNGKLFCPEGSFLVNFVVQRDSQRIQFSDQSSLQYISFRCQDKTDPSKNMDLIQYPGYWDWSGDYEYSTTCPQDKRVCGIKTKAQYYYNSEADNTGLNDIIMFCCP